MTLTPTPGQTVGPFFHYGLPYAGDRDLVLPGSDGAIRLSGIVYDGEGQPVPDALVEIWQARPDGSISQEHGSIRRDGWTFTGFGRASTGRDGSYSFSTLTPGATDAGTAPFFAVTVFARGLLDRLFTRAYLPGPAVQSDPFLASLAEAERATLVASASEQGFTFDIHLQGARETVFLHHIQPTQPTQPTEPTEPTDHTGHHG